ncbi:MAG: hypothetical protein M1837_007337 [Sclerophora amabilis]|nr:MAG: hypothetical protein M1837_007337 [Sclerophora amabilis]
MSSITLKITSLIVKTLSKPIANQIKSQAREHARFRRICVSFAQGLHRVDMRLRLGLLQDPAAMERQATKEAAEALEKKRKLEIPTVKTEAQMKADEAAAERNKTKSTEKPKVSSKPRIRPLSEAKAIDTGANFISETFLFLVGGSLIVFESFRSRRRENNRREDVADRLGELEENEDNARKALVALEKEIMRLRDGDRKDARPPEKRILPKEILELESSPVDEREDPKRSKGWWDWLPRIGTGGGIRSDSNQDEPLNPRLPLEATGLSRPDSEQQQKPVDASPPGSTAGKVSASRQ